MEILDNIVLPQSGNHLTALHYLLMLSMALLLLYTGALFGGTFFSLMFSRLKKYSADKRYIEISKNYIDLPTSNKSLSLGLALVPFLSIILSLSQLLHQGETVFVLYMIISFILYTAGIILIFTYKNSFDVYALIKSFEGMIILPANKKTDDAIESSKERFPLKVKAGTWGFVLLAISLWIFFGAFSGAMNKYAWANAGFFTILFSLSGLIKLFFFIAAALTFAAGYYLYIHFHQKAGAEESDVKQSILKFNLSISIILIVVQAVLLSINIFTFPQGSLSGFIFISLILSLIIALIAINMFYNMLKENKRSYIVPAFYSAAAVFVSFVIIDGSAFKVSNVKQDVMLAANYDKIHAQMLEKAGGGLTSISGEEIFNNRCSACHSFERQLVGPAYNNVLPKYEGKKNNLVAFILNPVKVDPKFPPMPNQGLKPNEAEAIAEYLLQTYKK
ncbi:MAG TPA: c-type cytochrome [Ignavibacteriales bacterium]|nr:c-type cytochrome [Ignavibacteriales bacterium]